mgnify:CR=1 FL=1
MRGHFFFLVLILFSCSDSDSLSDKILIATTTSMIGDGVNGMADTIKTQVKSLMGPGTDPHLFKPTKESLDLLAEADVIVANGLHLEGKMQDILEKLGRKKPVIFLGQGLSDEALIHPEGKSDYPDPHIWFNVSLWKESLLHLKGELNELGVVDETRANVYMSSLDTLHNWVMKEIQAIPDSNRVLLTAHDAFSYFGKAYEIEVIGLQGISTVAEYGLRDVSEMVDLILERRIRAVFVESSISPRAMEAVVSGVRQKDGEIVIGGTLYSDAPGPENSGASTYHGMVVHNVKTIKSALK